MTQLPPTTVLTMTFPHGLPLGARRRQGDQGHGSPRDPHLFALADIVWARREIAARGAAYVPCRVCRELQMVIEGDDGAVINAR